MRKGKSSNSDGLLVDTLYYRYKGVRLESGDLVGHDTDNESGGDDEGRQPGSVEEVEVSVEVRLRKTYDGDAAGENRPVKSLAFTLSCDAPEVKVSGSDIELLRKAMWGHLDKAYEVKWEPYFLVTIRPGISFGNGISHGFVFAYDTVYKGTAHDGALMMKKYSGYSHGYKVEPWPGRFKDEGGNLLACIEGTDENRQALKRFGDKVDQWREAIADFFKPEVIMHTLGNLGSLRILDGSHEQDEPQDKS